MFIYLVYNLQSNLQLGKFHDSILMTLSCCRTCLCIYIHVYYTKAKSWI